MKAIILILILALLIPVTTNAQEPTCWPPEEWQEEYGEWLAWQMELQREFTNQTGYGLGLMLDFFQWAELREGNEPYWWRVYYAYLLVEAYA